MGAVLGIRMYTTRTLRFLRSGGHRWRSARDALKPILPFEKVHSRAVVLTVLMYLDRYTAAAARSLPRTTIRGRSPSANRSLRHNANPALAQVFEAALTLTRKA